MTQLCFAGVLGLEVCAEQKAIAKMLATNANHIFFTLFLIASKVQPFVSHLACPFNAILVEGQLIDSIGIR